MSFYRKANRLPVPRPEKADGSEHDKCPRCQGPLDMEHATRDGVRTGALVPVCPKCGDMPAVPRATS